MAKGKPKNGDTLIVVDQIEMGTLTAHLLGSAAMIMNRFSQKAWQELLFPSAHRNRADLEQTLKHDPLGEFRGALYRNRDPKRPTLFHVPNGAFHGAIAQAAVDMPGAARAKIERLTKVVDVNVDLYGIPQIFCAMVRNSDMNRTPDVRTRPIFPEWACVITIKFVSKILTTRTISNLLGAAGLIVGIGDWRSAKGGPFGGWTVVSENDATFKRIVKTQGRAAQQTAYEKPVYYDEDTEELLTWFEAELMRRERSPASSGKAVPKTKVFTETVGGELVDA